MKKATVIITIAVLLVGMYALLAPGVAMAKKPLPPFPPLPCDHCEPWFKTTHCICHLFDCTPEDCAYVCDCW